MYPMAQYIMASLKWVVVMFSAYLAGETRAASSQAVMYKWTLGYARPGLMRVCTLTHDSIPPMRCFFFFLVDNFWLHA